MKKSRLTKIIAVILSLTIAFASFGAVTAGASSAYPVFGNESENPIGVIFSDIVETLLNFILKLFQVFLLMDPDLLNRRMPSKKPHRTSTPAPDLNSKQMLTKMHSGTSAMLTQALSLMITATVHTTSVVTSILQTASQTLLKASQKRTKRAPLRDALQSSTPASCLGWLATIPTLCPLKRAKPTTMFLA